VTAARHDPALRVRRASAHERDEVRALVREAYSRYVPRIGREPAPMNADYAALIGEASVWVGTVADQLVGVLVLQPGPRSLMLENVAVATTWQGRGIGRALIGFAEDRARALGLDEITLYTNEQMTENLALYPALGYEEVERRSEDGFRRVFFRKRLSG